MTVKLDIILIRLRTKSCKRNQLKSRNSSLEIVAKCIQINTKKTSTGQFSGLINEHHSSNLVKLLLKYLKIFY